MAEWQLIVMTDPVAKARARVVVRKGKSHGYTPTKTANAEWRIRSAFLERFPGHQPLTGPLNLQVVARLKMPLSLSKKLRDTALPLTRPDCDNYLKTVLDSLNGIAFLDDSQIVTASISKRYAGGLPPSWEIVISTVTLMAQPAATATVTPGVAEANGNSTAQQQRRTGLRRVVG